MLVLDANCNLMPTMTLVMSSCPLVGTLVKLSVAVVGDAALLEDIVVSPEV